MNRILPCALLLMAALPARAQDNDPTALFPADTFLLVEVDGQAVQAGLRQLDLAKILNKYRDFFRPTLEKLGVADAEDPAGELIKKLQLERYLSGRAMVGVHGVTVRIQERGGKETRLRIAPNEPVDARLVARALGLVLRMEATGMPFSVLIEPDLLAVVEPGERLKAAVANFLDKPPIPVEHEIIQMGDRQITHLKFQPIRELDSMIAPEIYADLSGPRWILSTSAVTLSTALAGGPRSSLARSPGYLDVRRRITGDNRALFVYVDAAQALQMARNFAPPILTQAMEMTGVSSLRGVGLGISLTGGGVRESLGIVLDGNPKGVWRLLDAFPPGLRSIEIAPPDAIAVVGLKFDAKIAMQRVHELAKELLPGTEDLIRPMLARAAQQAGFDLDKEILPALGDEIGLLVFPQGLAAMTPNWVFGLDVNNEAAFKSVLEKLKAMAPRGGVRFTPVQLREGVSGFQVFAPLPMQPPIFAVHKGHLFGASNRELLLKVFDEWGQEGAETLARDGTVFKQVMRGLNGGERKNLVALAYADMSAIAANLLGMGLLGVPEGWLDLTKTPDIKQLASNFKGLAIGLRRDGNGVTLDLFSPTGITTTFPVLLFRSVGAAPPAPRVGRVVRRRIVESADRRNDAFLGVSGLREADGKLFVGGTVEDSPARKAGIKDGDVIASVDGVAIKSLADLRAALAKRKPGDTVKVNVVGPEKNIVHVIKLARRG